MGLFSPFSTRFAGHLLLKDLQLLESAGAQWAIFTAIAADSVSEFIASGPAWSICRRVD